MLKASGKEVIFMVDGNVTNCADDIFACGARWIFSKQEPTRKRMDALKQLPSQRRFDNSI